MKKPTLLLALFLSSLRLLQPERQARSGGPRRLRAGRRGRGAGRLRGRRLGRPVRPLDGRLYVGMQPRAYEAADVVFLKHLLVGIPGKLIVIRDGTNIHCGAEMDAFLASTEGKRIEVEVLPGYAPELSPAEGIWGYLKQVELRNVRCESLNDLYTTVRGAIRRLQKKRRVLSAIVRHV